MATKIRLVLGMTWAILFALTLGEVRAQQEPAPADPLQLVNQGRKLLATGKLGDAIAKYQQALATDPKLFEAHLSLGMALDLKGAYSNARKHLEQAVAQASDNDADVALNALAISFVFARDVAGAARVYQQIFDRHVSANRLDSSAETANALGRVYLETGDTANARRWYQTAREQVQKLPGLSSDQIDLWEMRWHHALSRIAARAGDAETASREAAAVKALIDKGGLNATQQPIYDYLAGYNAFYAGDYDAAIAALQRADQRDPFILGLIAQAYEKKQDAATAKTWWAKVLASPAHNLQAAFTRPLAAKASPGSL